MAKKQSTSEYYKKNPESAEKRRAYQRAYNKKKSEVDKRVKLNKYNRDAGTYGNGDKKDAQHKGKKIVGFVGQSKNRGSKSDAPGDRRARGGKSTKK